MEHATSFLAMGGAKLRLLTLASYALVYGISPAYPQAQAREDTLVLEREGCYGSCPSYTITVFKDGRVVWRGKEYVRVKGKAHSRIPQRSHFWQTKYGQGKINMNTSQIDSVILSAVGEHWTKVAMVIVRVVDAVSHDLPRGDEGYEVISRRIEALVHDGRLVAQGDTKNWRFSEVRIKPN